MNVDSDTIALTVIGLPITVGNVPNGIAITPNGSRAYVTNLNDKIVLVIDTTSNTAVGSPIPVGSVPAAIAITPVNIL